MTYEEWLAYENNVRKAFGQPPLDPAFNNGQTRHYWALVRRRA